MRKDCRVFVLYSGSGGNSVFIRVGKSAILIDAGKSARALCRALVEIGEDIKNIDAIFITHEHSDHISALEVLSKKNEIPIYMTEVSAKRFDECPDSPVHKNLYRCGIEFSQQIGEMTVRSFRTPHDSRMSVGYRIEFDNCGQRYSLGLATDIGYVSESIRENLLGCDALIIESNHDEEMLMTGPYPRELKLRVASKRGHLSNRECSEFAMELADRGAYAFMLAHLSKENNLPDLAYEEISRALSGRGVSVAVAHPDMPVEFVLERKEDCIYDECEIYNPWNA